MALKIQYDLFENQSDSELKAFQDALAEVKLSSDKVRKGLFARHNELAKMYVELHNRMEIIERNLCKKE